MKIIVVGAGFTGLSAAMELAEAGNEVTILERDDVIGGLAGAFDVGGQKLEKFYHHWFTNDVYVQRMVERLGKSAEVVCRETHTGMYYANNFFRLSSPLDVLRFTPLSFWNRVRLGMSVLAVRRVKNWRELESTTAIEWLRSMCGEEVFKVVWEPLLVGKFGEYSPDVSAVWFWNKLKLRGSSRNSGGHETLLYYRGGFAALAEQMADQARKHGTKIFLGTSATGLVVENGAVRGVLTSGSSFQADAVLLTTPLPHAADLLSGHVDSEYEASLRRIRYLSNICLVLELDRSLSSTYWLNVNDPSFPFVGVIEHTNFEPKENYAGRHIVYLSKYLSPNNLLYRMSDEEILNYSVPYLRRLFPQFDQSWITGWHVWRADFSQPVVEAHYSKLIPDVVTPIKNVYLATMAQVYPEDRGTNYAIRAGLQSAAQIMKGNSEDTQTHVKEMHKHGFEHDAT